MDQGSTQPLTEMSAKDIRGDKGRSEREADKVTAISKMSF
jgi:hypothetical protein